MPQSLLPGRPGYTLCRIDLADYAGHLVMLDIACNHCDRVGQLSKDDMVLHQAMRFAAVTTTGCLNGRVNLALVYDLCGAVLTPPAIGEPVNSLTHLIHGAEERFAA